MPGTLRRQARKSVRFVFGLQVGRSDASLWRRAPVLARRGSRSESVSRVVREQVCRAPH